MSFLFTEATLIIFQFEIINHGLPIGSLPVHLLRFGLLPLAANTSADVSLEEHSLFFSQFNIHKSSGHLTVAKRYSPINQGKHKCLISLIRERTQQYQRFVFIHDHYIQICQIREKFRVDVDVITNEGSSLQLKMVKSPL